MTFVVDPANEEFGRGVEKGNNLEPHTETRPVAAGQTSRVSSAFGSAFRSTSVAPSSTC